jgi:hypothetical protein
MDKNFAGNSSATSHGCVVWDINPFDRNVTTSSNATMAGCTTVAVRVFFSMFLFSGLVMGNHLPAYDTSNAPDSSSEHFRWTCERIISHA